MSVNTKRLSVVFLFIINVVTGQDVCPPNNFSAEAGVAEVHLNWENPGVYYGIHELSPKDSAYIQEALMDQDLLRTRAR